MNHTTRNPRLLAAVGAVGLLGVAAYWYRSTDLMSPAPEWGAAPVAKASTNEVVSLERRIYPYSIVDGGVYSYAEAMNAVGRDPIVAAHYSDIDMAAVRPVVLTASRRAYVSYRLGGQVFWTRNPVTIKAGEAVLTDGKQKVRARCGNKISDKAMAPVADFEDPPEVSGDGPAVTMALNTPTPKPPDQPKKSKKQDDNPPVLKAARNPLQSFEPIAKEPDTAWWPPSSFPGGLIPNLPSTTNPQTNPNPPPVTPPPAVVTPPDPPTPPPPDIPGPPPVNPGTPDPPNPALPGEPPSLPPYIPPLPPPTLNEPTPPLSEPPTPIPPTVQPPVGPPGKPAITAEIPPNQPPGQVVNPPGGGGGGGTPPGGGGGGTTPGGNGNTTPPGGGGNPFAPVPEPSTFVVTGAILVGLAYRRFATRR